MKFILSIFLFLLVAPAFAVTWSYQVNVNGLLSTTKKIDSSKSSFEAGPHYCQVTPVIVNNNTEYRSLVCSVGTGTVSTGGLCTRKGSNVASVQYAILNLNGPKNVVNVVVSCKFD
jgi:hypothetical protein